MPDDSEDYRIASMVTVDILAEIEEATWGHSTENPEDQVDAIVLRLRVTLASYALAQVLLSELAPHTRKLVEEMGTRLTKKIGKLNLPPRGTVSS